MRRLALAFVLLAIASVCVAPSHGQVALGTPPFGSYSGGPGAINIGNLNVHWTIPIRQKPGRGTNFAYNLTFDTSVWAPVGTVGSQLWQPNQNWNWSGQNNQPPNFITLGVGHSQCTDPSNPGPQLYNVYHFGTYTDEFGIPHNVGLTVDDRNIETSCTPDQNESASRVLTDGSGLIAYVDDSPSVTLTKPDGTIVYPGFTGQSSSALSDRNGNRMTANSSGQFFDTLSSTTPVLTVSGSGTPASPKTFTYTAPSGASASYTMKYTSYLVQTAFGCSGITDYGTNGTTSANLVSEIDLPDGSKYTFAYENTPGVAGHVTGRLASVTLPTGGTITYGYTGGSSGHITCSDGSAATLTRTTPDGTWSYTRSQVSGNHWQTIATDPVLNQTAIDFQKDSNTSNYYETQRRVYQGSTSGTLLQTINTCFNGAASPCTATAITLPIASRSVVGNLPSSTLTSRRVDNWNTYGEPTEFDEYAFGSGAPGALLRKTLITYAALSNNIHAFSQTVTVCSPSGTASACGGTGTVVAQTTNSYDQTAVSANTGTTPQHIAVSGSRGNLTTVSYLTSGTNTLSKTFTYYDTGMLKTAVDVNGSSSTVTFNYPNATDTCGNAFPTSITEPLSLSRSMTWNCTGGVQLTATDENLKTTTTAYSDTGFWRPGAVTDPLNNQTTYYYQPNPSYAAFEVATFFTFNNGNSLVSALKYLDSLGRTYVDQRCQSPSCPALDTVSYTFDSSGRPASVSMPCSTDYTLTCSTPKTTTTYDALSRVAQVTDGGGGYVSYTYNANDVLVTVGPNPTNENTKRRQLEYDALGRLTSVCELTSATGSASCGQTTAATGFLTRYTYDLLGNLTGVTQNAQAGSGQQTRAYLYDSMGRRTSETNPESGLTLFSYDTATGCSASNGDLVKKVDQQGNTTCFAYDALHRNTSITYSGPYAIVTPNKYFVFDSATVGGTAMTNAKGRLAEAYTCTTCPGTKITDEGFSYTARGEVADVYQMTPHTSPNYYHVAQTYWPHGLPSQLSATYNGAAITGLPTITYGGATGSGLDGEGRVTQVTASTGQNPITAMNYSLYTAPPQITATLGSGDSDVFSFDANTGRMTQYKFNIGATPQSVVGNLTWNANGTLNKLVITDPFDSANNQTCNYAHDDLVRINSANCGAAASQTFSYDVFGNINKQGSPGTFNASYNSATNHITTVGGFTATYDNNGNVTADGLHTYSWDADGNSITQDTVNLTFDALGRMVEQARGTSYTQIVYSPTGNKLALMNGAALTKAFVPLPSGGTALYTSSGLSYYRHSDWLGSSRFASTTSRTMYSSTSYTPFGEPYAQAGTADLNFTGMNSDTSGSSYDFLARQYGTQGRWPSPDPAGLAAVDATKPQSWNRYAYVLNNPLALVDPTGEDYCETKMVGDDPQSSPEACFAAGGTWHIGNCSSPGGCAGSGGSSDPPPPPPPPFTYVDACDIFSCAGSTPIGGGGDGGFLHRLWDNTKQVVKAGVCTTTAPLVDIAHFNGGAVGIGVGGSAGAGLVFGLAAQLGVQVVADAHGNVGVAFSGGGNPGFGVFGAGAVGGAQFMRSSADTIFDLKGRSVGGGVSGGILGAGAGVDVAHSSSADTLTATVGPGVGGKGAGYAITYTGVPSVLSTDCGPK